jgi:hypothetical protein
VAGFETLLAFADRTAVQLGRPALGGNEKSLKKVLTLNREIQYHGARFQNRQRIFAR